MKFKIQFYGLSIKIKNALKIEFVLSEIVKLTIKNDWNLWNINICDYLKTPVPTVHRVFFKNNITKAIICKKMFVII